MIHSVADVLTFVFSSWGNTEKTVMPDEVAKVRRTSKFATYEALVRAHAFAPLPAPPKGMKIRELVQLPDFATRLAGPDRDGAVYVLGQKGVVYRLDVANTLIAADFSSRRTTCSLRMQISRPSGSCSGRKGGCGSRPIAVSMTGDRTNSTKSRSGAAAAM